MASISERKMMSMARMSGTTADRAGHSVEVAHYFRWKTWPGRILAALLLVPALPILLLTIVVVRLTSPGPGIYRQERVGWRGKCFTMYKIRTMRHDAEVRTGPTWATTNDPRLTGIGRFLRSIHLDELPQLLNVVRGEMALIGPRPERPEFTHILAEEVPGYMQRLLVRPGVTGLAQINLPPDTDFNSVRRKLVLDLEYIQRAGISLDARILCWTAFRLCGFRNLTTGLLGLARSVELPCERESRTAASRDTAAVRPAVTDTVVMTHHGNGHTHGVPTQKVAARPVKPR